MKHMFFLALCFVAAQWSLLSAQDELTPAQKKSAQEFLDVQSAVALSSSGLCPGQPCPCNGGFREMQVYFFGAANSQVEVFANKFLTVGITSFASVATGQLLTISGAGQPGGELPTHIYLRVTEPGGRVCVTSIYARCPSNAWPGALEDLRVIGKMFGDFFVYGHRDTGNSFNCTIDDIMIEQDWRVGGNVIGSGNNRLGTLTDRSMVFISNNTPRGILTNTGNWGLGTLTPAVRLDVGGDAHISQSLDVDGAATVGGNFTVEPAGLARIQNNTGASAPDQGALVVNGGVGVGQNLYAGNDIHAGNDLISGRNLSVGANANIAQDLITGQNIIAGNNLAVLGMALVEGNTRLNSNALIMGNLNLEGTATIEGFTRVNDNARITGNLNLDGRLTVGAAGVANIQHTGGAGLLIENQTGNVRIEASNEEMVIVSNTQVEVKKRLIVTGADLAERFEVADKSLAVLPGMVLSIDKDRPGKLLPCQDAYDKKVAGIVSGAGGVHTAMLLGQEGTLADGDVPVAIVGRVYCYVDASFGAVEPGDMLTTSPTLGHAMKANDMDKARGAIIGKAMTGLAEGKGLVLVLITMQ